MLSKRSLADLAVVVGAVAVISVASLAVFFAVGGPFGAINDWTIGLLGLLTGLFVLALYRSGLGAPGALGTVATGVAVVGALIVVAGAALVISRATGFVLAGFVESLGFALIGLWLIVLNGALGPDPRWPRRLPGLGIAAGICMVLGFVVVPGITAGIDDMESVPAWMWLGFAGWLGIFFLYPIWCIWFGSALRRAATVGTTSAS